MTSTGDSFGWMQVWQKLFSHSSARMKIVPCSSWLSGHSAGVEAIQHDVAQPAETVIRVSKPELILSKD